MKQIASFIYSIFGLMTAMIGYSIHHSVFWSVMDFCFVLFAWGKWLVLHQVNLSVIRHAFGFLAA